MIFKNEKRIKKIKFFNRVYLDFNSIIIQKHRVLNSCSTQMLQ